MDPLLWITYLASAAVGPAAIAGLTTMTMSTVINGDNDYTPTSADQLKIGATVGLASIPFSRHYSEVSRNLEKCVLKKATVKTHPDGRLLVIPYSQARREALDAAVPVWFYYSFPLLVSAIASDNDKDRLVTSLIGSACAALAAACRLQSAWAGGNGHEDLPRGGRLGKPLLYFNKVDAAASSVDEYSAEVKRILDSRKNKKNSPASATGGGGGSFSWFKNRSAAQKKQPEHLGMLLAGMK
ncbi:hypothetical protein NADE_003829 [Nannochloris sp. 'desiccata']|nr:hypothetical protein KSW81_003973 [Chlorella desiccata (nom. nud.)]KAH7624477.1 hypothetical protein NADE_003829 [Chlorella desiccata (nom. nud.)]